MIREGLNLSPEMEQECDGLTDDIASFFLPYFKRRIEHTKTKSDENIVKYYEYYRLASEYRKNKQHFDIKKDDSDSTWGRVSFFISSKNGVLSKVFLKITHGYDTPSDGYVPMKDTSALFLLVDSYNFVKQFKKSTEHLRETIKHEARHLYQMSNKDLMRGLPKKDVRSKDRDVFGYNLKGLGKSPHVKRDIEFKPNVHTYAFHIKKHLNRFYEKSAWKEGFKKLISGEDRNSKPSDLNDNLANIDSLKYSDVEKWKLFIKEIYKEIFG